MPGTLGVEVAPPSMRETRWIVRVLGIAHLLLGWGNANLTYLPWPMVWASCYWVAGLACYSLLITHMTRKMHVAIVGTICVCAHIARAMALWVSYNKQMIPSGRAVAPLLVGMGWSFFVAFLLFLVFGRGMTPLAGYYERQERAERAAGHQ